MGSEEHAARATAMAAANRRCFIDWLARLFVSPLSLPLDAGLQVIPLVLNKVVAADIGASRNAVFCEAHADSAIRQGADLFVHAASPPPSQSAVVLSHLATASLFLATARCRAA